MNQQHLYGVSVTAERSLSSFALNNSSANNSHDSEQRGEPAEDPERPQPDPGQDPVPVAAGHEESGDHLEG